MSKLTPQEAADAVEVDRATIYRLMKNGDLSYTLEDKKKRFIDIVELQRIYPDLQIATDGKPLQMPKKRQNATEQIATELRVLQVQLEAKSQEAADLRQQLRDEREGHTETKAEKARFLDMLEEAQKRIPALPAPTGVTPTEEPQPKRGFWGRLFDKS